MKDLLQRIDAVIKAMSTTSTLGANSLLRNEKADRYIRMLQNGTVVLPQARFKKMGALTSDLDKIGFSGQILKAPPAEGAAFSSGSYTGVSSARVVLTATKAMAVVPLTDEVLEQNIERDGFETTLLDMIAQRAGLDVEEWGINGDTGSGNALYALNDGWLKKCGRVCVEDAAKTVQDTFTTGAGETTQTLDHSTSVPILIYPATGYWQLATGAYPDAGGDTKVARDNGDGTITALNASGISGTIDYYSGDVTLAGLTESTQYYWLYVANSFDIDAATGKLWPENMFERMLLCLPKPYKKRFNELRFWVPWSCANAYHNILQNRGTPLGDNTKTGQPPLYYKSVLVEAVPSMPENKAWLAHPNNTVYGVFKNITLEAEREAKASRTDFVNTLWVDFEHEDSEAAIRADY